MNVGPICVAEKAGRGSGLKRRWLSRSTEELLENRRRQNRKNRIPALNLKRYRKHFRDPEIREFDMQHEQWLFGGERYTIPVLKAIDEFMETPV